MTRLSAASIRSAVLSRERSAVDFTREALARAAALNPPLNALTQILNDSALAQAAAVDASVERVDRAHTLPLAGVPIVLKDNICLVAGRTTCASRFLEHYRSPFNATAAQRLLDAGAIIIAKANLDEFAMGSSTERSCFGPTRNPWDLSRVPGGSSGGSAAAVSAGIVPIALGSDTGGSIRQPAGFCGLVGIKPTYGRVSRYGLVAYASSLDQIGPLTTSVADAALTLDVICGQDPLDATSSPAPARGFASALDQPIPDLAIAVPRSARSAANHPDVARVFEESINRLRALGARIIDVDLELSDAAIAAYYIIATAEASSNLARFDGIRYGRRPDLPPSASLDDLYRRARAEGFGPEVKRRIMLGTHVLSSGYYDAYYTTALKARRRILADYNAALATGAHAILMPVAPGPAFPIGDKTSDPLAMYLEDVYTVGVNLAGLPAISVPAGFANVPAASAPSAPAAPSAPSAAGRDQISRLPIGIQLIGAAFDESTILRIAAALEAATDDDFTPPAPAA